MALDPSLVIATPAPPRGMVAVPKDQFFALLSADGRDIMPNHMDPDHTSWETQRREVWGWSTPGWRNPGDAASYAVNFRSLPAGPPAAAEAAKP